MRDLHSIVIHDKQGNFFHSTTCHTLESALENTERKLATLGNGYKATIENKYGVLSCQTYPDSPHYTLEIQSSKGKNVEYKAGKVQLSKIRNAISNLVAIEMKKESLHEDLRNLILQAHPSLSDEYLNLVFHQGLGLAFYTKTGMYDEFTIQSFLEALKLPTSDFIKALEKFK